MDQQINQFAEDLTEPVIDLIKQGLNKHHRALLNQLKAEVSSKKSQSRELACYKSGAARMAKAIQRFRNLDQLKDLGELRGTQEYHDLCLAWKEFDDATGKQHRENENA